MTMSKQFIKTKKLKDLQNNVKSRESVLKNFNQIYNNWDKIEEYFELRNKLDALTRRDD